MRLVLEKRACEKQGLTEEEALVALGVRNVADWDGVMASLEAKEAVVVKDGRHYVTQGWSEKLNFALSASRRKSLGAMEAKRIDALADKMRAAYPDGRMPGTAYYYRCNRREVRAKLERFFDEYGEYSDEDILEAEKRFVSSFNGSYRYLPLIKYFIMKDKKVEGEDGLRVVCESRLAEYLDNKGSKDLNDEWTTTAR